MVGRIPVMDVMPLVDLGRLPAKATVGEPLPVSRDRVPRGSRPARGRGRAGRARRLTPRPGADGRRRRRARPLRRVGHPRQRGRLDLRGARVVRPARHLGARCRAEDPGRGRRGADVHRGRAAARPRSLADPALDAGQEKVSSRGAASAARDTTRPGRGPARGPAVTRARRRPGRPPAARAGDRRGSLPAVRRPAAGAVQQLVRVLPAVRGRDVRREDRDGGRAAPSARPPKRLDAVAAMGFDVVYLPPIHPIGEVNRKGPNNTLDPGPDDPGSPWAIGSKDGGHDAIHPDLGTIEDFDAFVAKAAAGRARGRARPGPAVRARPPLGDQRTPSGSPRRPTARSPTPRTRRRSTRTSTR